MAPGVWRHPRDRSDRYLDLQHWTDLAALLEQGKVDGLFLADVLGTYDVYQGKADAAIRQGIQTPVNGIAHTGKYFRVPGFHLCEPSPQRTPVLYQAGASRRGKEFAAKHAECVFLSAPSAAIVKGYVQDLRGEADKLGRGPILIFMMFTIVVAPTDSGKLSPLPSP